MRYNWRSGESSPAHIGDLMKKTTKKLTLSKETLRLLGDAALGKVGAGNAPVTEWDCPTMRSACCP